MHDGPRVAANAVKRLEAERVIGAAAPDLLRFFLHRVPDDADAADLLGETLAAAWRSVKRMPTEPEAARMWLFGVAKNTLRRSARTRVREQALVEKLATTLSGAVGASDDDAIDVRSAVAALPTALAELIRLVHWDGFSLEDAADHLGIPASTARTRHARAKELLRAKLAPSHHVEYLAPTVR